MSTSTSTLDHAARDLARRVAQGALSNDAAARELVAKAVETGEVERAVAGYHGHAFRSYERDEYVSAAIFLLVNYALPTDDRPSPLDVRVFWTKGMSAQGWVRRTVQVLRPSRIRREMAVQRDAALLDHDEETWDEYELDAEDDRDLPSEDDLDDASRDLLRTGETLTMVHASVLHRLFSGPALRSWELTASERRELLAAISEDPDLPRRALAEIADSDEEFAIQELWAAWGPSGIEEVLAQSSPVRDIPALLTRAALCDLPRPPAGRRGETITRMRRRVVQCLSGVPRDLSSTLLDSFLAARVALYADKDRRRRPLSRDEQMQRAALASSFPVTLSAVQEASGVARIDLVSGLTALVLDEIRERVHVLDPDSFTPTTWRFTS